MVRIKYRYLLLNILYPETSSAQVTSDTPAFLKFRAPTPRHLSPQLFVAHLKSHISANFGDQGLGFCLSSLKLVYLSNATSTAILRVPRTHYQIVWAALSYMTVLPAPKERNATTAKCVVRVVRVSGTIRKAEEELLRRSRRDVVQAKLAGQGVQSAVLNRLTSASGALLQDDLQDPVSDFDNASLGSESE